MIGSTPLPATIPLVIESTQLNNEDQLEIISSSQTKKNTVEEDDNIVTVQTTTTTTTTEVEIADTQAYTLEPVDEMISSNNQLAETQPYELESEEIITDVIETKREEVRKVVVNGDAIIEQITTTTTTTTVIENENLPMETLAYDLQPTHKESDLETTAPAVCADTQAYSLDEEIGDSSPRPASETLEVVPVSQLVEQLNEVENIPDDATPKQQVEITIDQDVIKEVATDELMDTNQPGKNDLQKTRKKRIDYIYFNRTFINNS